MAAWITVTDLRNVVGAKQPVGDDVYAEACVIACAEVERLCGPVAFTNVADEIVLVSGSDRACLKYRATEGLTAVSTHFDGTPLTLGDYAVDGQVFRRRDRGSMSSDLLVSYRTGYYDATTDTEETKNAPAWAKAMAKLIAHQYVRVTRRFKTDPNGQDDLSGTGYLVPAAALAVGRDYLLSPGGVG